MGKINNKVWITTKKNKNKIECTIKPYLNVLVWSIFVLFCIFIFFISNYFLIFKSSYILRTILKFSGIATMILIYFFTNQGRRNLKFLREARLEMRKIKWPKKQDTINSTLIVSLIVILSSLVMYFVGFFLSFLVQSVIM